MRPSVVIGAGILGLATARALQRLEPDRPVLVLEKEDQPAVHQTGHNSGVIHSGLYYKPGSLKARLAVEGAAALKEFCVEQGIPMDVPGKLVVATRDAELPQLDRLLDIGRQNGVPVRRLDPHEITEREPHLRVLGALAVDSTGTVDYRLVAAALADCLRAAGGEIRTGVTVTSIDTVKGVTRVRTSDDVIEAARVTACAGLHSDRLARASGIDPGVRILPFRGEYSEIVPERAHLVKGLVYPVPDPELPFLGIHLTRGIDGTVHLGPNAVPALAREGYRWTDVVPRDVWESMSYPGAWKMARRYARTGVQEIARSLAGRALVRSAQQMLPDLRPADVRRSGAGVRAQAVTRAGQLVDDFLFLRDGRTLHVLNAPSPAATACLPIGEHIARELCAE
ncbi:L-2-hydroxyglutarate oxidase [Streptomyces sp. NBC_01314]|uniref:L-2-hydroxyglutarate oxidase n=1 Tax=Streptomyces sp. NBC_01314 TaxID=2903821 RepID=UPI00308A1E78|nr:L-2-hydroxyglutarate oxidase [Streptomyces sp. NBC_01314]